MASSYLQRSRHGSVYYFRRRLPIDLYAAGAPQQIFRSLHTTERRVAIVRARALAAASDELFCRLRVVAKNTKQPTTGYTLKIELDSFGKPSALVLDAQPNEKDAAHEGLAVAIAELGKVTPAITTAVLKAPGRTLSEAIAAYRAGAEIKPRSARRYAPVLARVEEFFGGSTTLATITQSRFADYVNAIKAEEGPAIATKNTYIKVAGRLFVWCRSRYDEAPTITTASLKLKNSVPANLERAAFTIDELRLIIDAAKRFRAKQPHKFWITVLAAFTGARVEELAQLDIHQNIAKDIDCAYWFIEINEVVDGDRSVKNLAGWRKVPLHPALIAAGFLDYLAGLRHSGETRLFPPWKPRHDPEFGGTIFGHAAVKWAGREMTKLRSSGQITRPKLTYLHSMRHAVINHMKQRQVDESLRAALVGHEFGGINNNRYGKEYAVGLLGDTLVAALPEYASLLA
jgi:integrase